MDIYISGPGYDAQLRKLYPPQPMVQTQRIEPSLDVSELHPQAKQRLWRFLKAKKPALAALLGSPQYQQITRAFNGSVQIPLSQIQGWETWKDEGSSHEQTPA